jgi:hypothetical protein
MATRGKMKQRLLEERDRLLQELEALRHRIGGLELAISLLEKEDEDQSGDEKTSGRGQAKELLLDLLREAGTTGLNATTAVEIAARRGKKLARGTAASTLSRMKADGVVTHENDRYRLVEITRPKVGTIGVGGTGSSLASTIAALAASTGGRVT